MKSVLDVDASLHAPDFPDSRIGASLKSLLAERNHLRPVGLPRFANRGLIEVNPAAPAKVVLTFRLPRFANRGLIEVTRRQAYRTLASNFPDSRIGASLKWARRCPPARRPRHFPDSRIGASLKLDQPAFRYRIEVHFPDSRIGASLKCPDRPRSPRGRTPLPRFANRGLIEVAEHSGRPRRSGNFPDSRIGASLKSR